VSIESPRDSNVMTAGSVTLFEAQLSIFSLLPQVSFDESGKIFNTL
jgi:hypothetical protein